MIKGKRMTMKNAEDSGKLWENAHLEPGERIPWLREQKSEDRACSKGKVF